MTPVFRRAATRASIVWVLLVGILLISREATADTFEIAYGLQSTTQLFGGSTIDSADVVVVAGLSGALSFPSGQFSTVELQVGTLSITTHIERDLPHGFIFFDFPLAITVNGTTLSTVNQLMLTVDNSNDGATLLGGLGLATLALRNGMTIGFQTATAGTGAAGDNETKTVPLFGQFYSSPTAVPEPLALIMLVIGAGIGSLQRRLKAR